MSFRILVVDDHPDQARVVSILLGLQGHTCKYALDGASAIALAVTFQPEIAILDVGLPDLSGYEVAQTLRQSFGAAIYLASITGWGQPEDRLRATAATFDLHLLKPVDAAQLADVVDRAKQVLERHG